MRVDREPRHRAGCASSRCAAQGPAATTALLVLLARDEALAAVCHAPPPGAEAAPWRSGHAAAPLPAHARVHRLLFARGAAALSQVPPPALLRMHHPALVPLAAIPLPL
jgi:hypothetical protein